MTAGDAATVATTCVRLRPLTLVEDGDDVLVGDPEAGTFVAVPPVGAVVIRGLQAGATLDQVAAEAQRHAGEPVDVAAFVEALRELGFVDDPRRPPGPAMRTAPIQQRGWLGGIPQRYARLLFTPAAWCLYVVALLFCIVCFALRPALWPGPGEIVTVDDDALGLAAAVLLSYLLTGVHEVWHWLGARSLGLSARFGVDRRFYFVVFETDLSQLWTAPRRRRYGPLLAGLAIDVLVLAGLLAAKLLVSGDDGSVPPAGRWLSTVIYLLVMSILWQSMIFLRTDLYAVLVTATGCRNLWETKSLLLRRALWRITARQRAELAHADPRDLRVGLWFRWVYLGGLLVVLGFLGYFVLPGLASLGRWSAHGLAAGPGRSGFWLTAVVSVALCAPVLAGLVAWLAAALRRIGPARRRAHTAG